MKKRSMMQVRKGRFPKLIVLKNLWKRRKHYEKRLIHYSSYLLLHGGNGKLYSTTKVGCLAVFLSIVHKILQCKPGSSSPSLHNIMAVQPLGTTPQSKTTTSVQPSCLENTTIVSASTSQDVNRPTTLSFS
jgi:hypothetical protein